MHREDEIKKISRLEIATKWRLLTLKLTPQPKKKTDWKSTSQ